MRTKKEILSELFKPYVEKLSNIEKLLEFSGSLTTKGWEIVEQAMSEWHKECLPTDDDIEKAFTTVPEAFDSWQQKQSNDLHKRGARWCRDFKREENVAEPKYMCRCANCNKNVTEYPLSVWDNEKNGGIWFCSIECLYCYIDGGKDEKPVAKDRYLVAILADYPASKEPPCIQLRETQAESIQKAIYFFRDEYEKDGVEIKSISAIKL